ncbi:hypothetical protein ACIBSW_18215 [Actinoplanes sp. NPDC049668]|uniref:hypothetical protein n=1 Tax=unclassified Actinoplanes TaxID=2626549 RepID=UPI0033BC1FC1
MPAAGRETMRGLRLLAIVPVLAAGLTVGGDDVGYRLTAADDPVFRLGAESRAGDPVCARSGPPSEPATDRWTYRAISSRASGLVLTDLRLGPRRMADAVGVAQVRIRTADGTLHNGFLTPGPRPQPDDTVASRLLGPVDCSPVEGDEAVTATYAVTVGGDVTVLFEQQYRFSELLDDRCEPTLKSRCKRFWPTTRWAASPADSKKVRSVSVVQRFAWDPDDGILQGSGGGAELIKDVVKFPSGIKVRSLSDLDFEPETLSGGGGHLRRGGARKVIDGGEVRGAGWENYHQSSRHGVGLPSPVSAGCSDCVHVHWSWFADPRPAGIPLPKNPFITGTSTAAARWVANRVACRCPLDDFSDGGPQIPDGSRQTACVGWTTDEPTEPVDWCRPGAEPDLSPSSPPVMYWDATSNAADQLASGVSIRRTDYAVGDAYWQKLPDRRHGGDGSFFFVPARRLATPEEEPRGATTATIEPAWPATKVTGGFPAGRWMLPIRIALDREGDQGPYYLRVRSRGPQPVNADSRGPGGPAWLTIRDGTADRRIVARYTEPMAATLLFDREPKPDDLSFRLDAAPDGIPGYVPSDGTWTDPSTVGDAAETIDWLAVVRRHLTDCTSDQDTSEVALAEDFPPRSQDITGDGQDDVFVGAKCRSSASAALLYAFDGASDSRDPRPLDVVDGRDHPVFDLTGATLGTTDDTVKIYGTNPRDADGALPYRDIELALEWHDDRLRLTRIDAEDCEWPVYYFGPDQPEIVCH